MKPNSENHDDDDHDDDSLHFEDCVNLFPSKHSQGSNQHDETLFPPASIECSFANSSSTSQGSSGFLGISDNDDDEEDHEDVVVEEANNDSVLTKPFAEAFDAGHCNWANVSTNHLIKASSKINGDGPINKKNKKKSVHFATNAHDGSIQCTVHCLDSTTMTMMMTADDDADSCYCWWRKKDAIRIHAECQAVVTHYRKHCPDYMDAIAGLSFSSDNIEMTELEILDYQNVIAASASARGLEGYICDGLKNVLCKTHRGLVLLTQYEHRHDSGDDDNNNKQPPLLLLNDNGDLEQEAIRQASLRTSLPSRQLALKLAEYDALEAVKAMHMPWNINDDDDNIHAE